jgi:Holliday junction resolvase RusA-like endonuclease
MTLHIDGLIPSANKYWRTRSINGRAVTYVSDEAKAFKMKIYLLSKSQKIKPTINPVSVQMVWHRKTDKSRGDLDNRIKVVLDSLIGIAYVDDKQVEEIHIVKSVSGRDGMDITVKEVL